MHLPAATKIDSGSLSQLCPVLGQIREGQAPWPLRGGAEQGAPVSGILETGLGQPQNCSTS